MTPNPTAAALDRLRRVVEDGGTAPAIDAALEPVALARDPSSIAPLLGLLAARRDEGDDEDGLWSILHAAEAFDDAPYVAAALEALPGLEAARPDWAEIVLLRILNAEGAQAVFADQVRHAPEHRRAALRSICARLIDQDADLAKAVAAVAAAVGLTDG